MIRLPSTVLAQADAGVGVKNGVNAFGQKNFVGTFAPPFGVVIDFQLLDTLPERDRRAGMAEAVKVALVRDAAFFEWIQQNVAALRSGNREALAVLVRRTAELHLRHIAQGGDPFESGTARPLDFGHWAAHKLEILSGHRLRHGEAVAIGMALDCLYATQAGLLDWKESNRALEVLRGLGFSLWDEALEKAGSGGDGSAVLDGIEEFRQHLGGQLTLTLLRRIGEGVDIHHIDVDLVRRAIELLAEEAVDETRRTGNGAHVLHQRPSGHHLARGEAEPRPLRRSDKSTGVP
jgi:3-dehydroquinate synthase